MPGKSMQGANRLSPIEASWPTSPLELNVFLDKLPAAAYLCDAEGYITYYNQRAVELWGRAPKLNDEVDRFCGSFKLFSREGAPIRHDECWMALALQHGKSYDGHEIVIERPDGSRWVALAHANPFHNELGQVTGAVNVLVDITERRRSELALAQLAAIVESSDDAIISKNLQGVIQSWNAAAERLFGYTAEQAIGRHVSFLFPPDRLDEEDHILARLHAGERVYHFDTVRVRSDGRPIHVSLTISPIRDETGRIIGASKIARDISDHKQAEERIYGLLAQHEEADRRKDEFLAMLAHELRNPLGTLHNVLELMKRENGNGGGTAALRETLERQLGQMERLVDDLLDVSRITRGKLEMRKESVELGSVISQCVETCRPLAESLRHELNVSLPAEPVDLYADRARLAQVFSNLLTNACKYTEPRGRICVTVERHGGEVMVCIQDTGVGIARDKLDSIFEMFSQLDRSLDRSRGGLGIGLALVRRLVEVHGGSVEARSDGPGQGSTFVVRLPVLLEPPPTGATPPPEAAASATRRILIVDDNHDAAQSLALLLELTGHETQAAHDGLQALEMAEQFRPHVVLLDIGLPKISGHEVCRRIRDEAWGKPMKLIALTGWGQDEDRRQSTEAGFDHHMVKPLDLPVLEKLLAQA
jgi:two-component system CheB/CheR fusion protein